MNQEEIIHDVQKRLFEMQDAEYRDFHAKLVPTMEKTKFIGIRTPMLRKFAKKFGKTEESEIFLLYPFLLRSECSRLDWIKNRPEWSSQVAQWVKDPALSLDP